jgi:hypothetical protein
MLFFYSLASLSFFGRHGGGTSAISRTRVLPFVQEIAGQARNDDKKTNLMSFSTIKKPVTQSSRSFLPP